MKGRYRCSFIAILSVMVLLCGCTKESEDLDAVFGIEDAVACLTDDDRAVIDAVCANPIETDDEAANAIETLKEHYAKIAGEVDSATERRRRAAISWKIAEISYNHFNGTCSVQVMFAAQAGLIEAQMMMENPPRGLTSYLLPPGDPRRIEDE